MVFPQLVSYIYLYIVLLSLQILTDWALTTAGTAMSIKGSKILSRKPRTRSRYRMIKHWFDILLMISILVATVAFTAGLTVPGGLDNSSDDRTKGMAILANEWAFQAFVLCDTFAMFCSIMGVFILIWSIILETEMAESAISFAVKLVGIALLAMSLAFMLAIYLVANISWVKYAVFGVGFLFVTYFFFSFFLLIFPFGTRHPVLHFICHFAIPMIYRFLPSNDTVKVKHE